MSITTTLSRQDLIGLAEEFSQENGISASVSLRSLSMIILTILKKNNLLSSDVFEDKFTQEATSHPLYEKIVDRLTRLYKKELVKIRDEFRKRGEIGDDFDKIIKIDYNSPDLRVTVAKVFTTKLLQFLKEKKLLVKNETGQPSPPPPPGSPPGGSAGALTDEELGAGLGKKLYQRSSVTDAYFLPFLDSFVGKQDGLSNKEKAAFSKVSRYLLNLLISKRVLFESRVILEQGELSAEISNRPPEQYPLWDELKSKIDELLMQDAALLNVFRDAGITPTQFLTNFIQVLKDNKKLGYRKPTNESLNRGSAKIDETVRRWQKLAGLIK